MSWNAYIDMLVANAEGNCDKGCIFSFEDGGMWTSHLKHLNITPAETKGIIEKWMGVDPKAMVDYYGVNGITIGGIHYRFSIANDGELHFSDTEKGYVVLQKTKKAVIAAHMPKGGNPDKTLKAAAAVGEYIQNAGY